MVVSSRTPEEKSVGCEVVIDLGTVVQVLRKSLMSKYSKHGIDDKSKELRQLLVCLR